MPTYEYRCAKCGEHFDVYQSFSEDPLTKHPGCGGKVTKVMAAAGIVLKGSGFYKTDNRSSSKGAAKEKKAETSSASSDASSSGSSGGSSSEGSTGAKKDAGTKKSGAKSGSSQGSGGSAKTN